MKYFNLLNNFRWFATIILLITLGIGQMWGATANFTYSNLYGQGTSGSGSNFTGATIDDITMGGKGYGNTSYVQIYANGTLTFTPLNGVVITKIELTGTSTTYIRTWSASSGSVSVSNTKATWTGSASSKVTLTNTASSQARITKMDVTYAVPHTLSSSVSPTGTGSVSLSATSVAEGKTATATATPNTGYQFSSWSISGTGASLSSTSANPTTVTMGTANATVTANFTQAPKASITLSEAGATTTDATSYYVGEEYTLPSSTGASCGTKVLVGWSTVEVPETNTKPTSNYYEKGAKVTLAATQTFYAVFANTSSGYKDTTVVEDFEKQSAGTNYQTTVPYEQSKSNAKIGWTMYYGTVSTTGPLIGSKSAQMRWYSSATSNYPYIQDTTQLLSLSKIKFKAKVGNTYLKMDVWYSANGGSWTKAVNTVTFASTDTITLSYNIPGADATKYRIKIGVSSSSTAPKSSYYSLLVDNVAFTYKTPTTIYTNYTTTCCTSLGQINGSFFGDTCFLPLSPDKYKLNRL